MPATQVQVVKKMSTKLIWGKTPDIRLLPENVQNAKRDLYTVFGIARGTKTGSGNYGDWTMFKGDFTAINHESGEEFRAVGLFLPEIAETPIINALAEADSKGVEFGFIVGVKESPIQGKIEYYITPLEKPRESDALTALRAKLLAAHPIASVKQLPAPAAAKAEKETAKPASKK